MLKTIAKLLAHRQLKFEEGYITLFEQNGLMLPVSTVVEIQKKSRSYWERESNVLRS